jgi:hypothetical protein
MPDSWVWFQTVAAGFQPAVIRLKRLLMISPADGCKRLVGGCLLESERLANNEEADRLLQASGLRLLVLGGLYPADVPSTM